MGCCPSPRSRPSALRGYAPPPMKNPGHTPWTVMTTTMTMLMTVLKSCWPISGGSSLTAANFLNLTATSRAVSLPLSTSEGSAPFESRNRITSKRPWPAALTHTRAHTRRYFVWFEHGKKQQEIFSYSWQTARLTYRTNYFGRITKVGEKSISMGQPRLDPKMGIPKCFEIRLPTPIQFDLERPNSFP